MAYLDHAATAPMRPGVLDAMLPYLTEHYGNPSGSHAVARRARRAVDEAREVVAEALGARPSEVVFTGGGTEADNLAVFGTHRARGGGVVCSAVEHHAVLEPALACAARLAPVDGAGRLELDALAELLDPSVQLVSVMLANNEVGTVQPVAEVAALVAERAPQAVLHTDAVQALPWLDVATLTAGADLISVSAHKVGGPKGVGALVVRDGMHLEPLVLGGGQEHERRSGTHDVAGIVGFAAALTSLHADRSTDGPQVAARRDRLVDELMAAVPELTETGLGPATTTESSPTPAAGHSSESGTVDRSGRLPGHAHVCIEGAESESLLFLLEQGGVMASAASSCASGALAGSHVLTAMGVPAARAAGSLRLTLGPATTDADVDLAIEVIAGAASRLRDFRRAS